MRDIFTPIFLLTLLVLVAVNQLPMASDLASALIIITAGLALLFFQIRKYICCYLFLALTVSIIIARGYLNQKEEHLRNLELAVPQNQYVSITGTLGDYPEIHHGFSVLILRSFSFEFERKKVLRSVVIRIQVAGDVPNLNRGDRIVIGAALYSGRTNKNFYPNPVENYRIFKNIQFQAYCKSGKMIAVIRGASLFWKIIGFWRLAIRRVIEEKFLIGKQLNPKGVFLEATILGNRGRLQPDIREQLMACGAYHLIAISGGNVAVTALFTLFFLKWLGVPARQRSMAVAFFLILFLMISGFDISAQRSVLMAVLIFLARAFFQDVQILGMISFSGILVLAFNPAGFLDPGFVLTYALTAAIVFGRSIFLVLFKGFPRSVGEFLSAHFSASLLAIPLSFFFFKRYSFSGFLSGLILIPLSSLITAAGVLIIPLSLVSSFFCHLVLTVADPPLSLFFLVMNFFARHLNLTLFRPSCGLAVLVCLLLLFYAVSCRSLPAVLRLLLGLIFGLQIGLGLLRPAQYQSGQLEVFFLDVGHGDSALVVFPSGQALLIDGGGAAFSDFAVGRHLVMPFLVQKGIRVKWVALSHFHPDHVKGILEILADLKPAEIWISSRPEADPFFLQLQRIRPRTTAIRRIDRGFKMGIDSCRIECLFPEVFITAQNTANFHSQVLKISGPYHSFLFTGDIETQTEALLVKRYGSDLQSDVLKVPHHGSQSSSSVLFLKTVRPQLAVVSNAASGRFPHPEVCRAYRREKITLLSTALRGGIRMVSQPTRLLLETSK